MKLVFTFFVFFFVTVALNAQVQYIAHRGSSFDAPENTVASAKLAWETGADAVEIDIHLAKDNRVMVIHDEETKRTCKGKNFEIKTTPSILLRDLDAGIMKGPGFKGEKIPYIDEIIETVPKGKYLVVEIKCNHDVFPLLHKVIEKGGRLSDIVFICFDWDTMLEAQKEFPGNACYWLSGSKGGLRKKMEQASEAGLKGVDLKSSVIDEEVMGWAKELKLDVVAYTVDDPKEAKRLISLGVNKITTNRPKWLKEQVN
jgi:glycerophosphoryl diester phosphodiesterase